MPGYESGWTAPGRAGGREADCGPCPRTVGRPTFLRSTELSVEEAAGFWSEVARVARAVDDEYRPAKMNWFSLGNGVPHLHVHLVPRPLDDARPGWPVESEAFDFGAIPPVEPTELAAAAGALRARLAD